MAITIQDGATQTPNNDYIPNWFYNDGKTLLDREKCKTIRFIPAKTETTDIQNETTNQSWNIAAENSVDPINCYATFDNKEEYYDLIIEVPDDGINLPESTRSMFEGFTSLEEISTDEDCNIYWTSVTTLNQWFRNDQNLKKIDIPQADNDDSLPIINSFSQFLQNCKKLTSIKLPKAKIELKVDENNNLAVASGFANCNSLKIIDFTPWTSQGTQTNNVTCMGLFSGCTQLQQIIGLENLGLQTSHMLSGFSGCTSLKELNLNAIQFSAAGTFANLFGLASIEGGSIIEDSETNNYLGGSLKKLQKISIPKSLFNTSPEILAQIPPSDLKLGLAFPLGVWYDIDGKSYNIQNLYEKAWSENSDATELSDTALEQLPVGKTLYKNLAQLEYDMPITMAEMTALADAIREKCSVNSWMTIDELIDVYVNSSTEEEGDDE